MEVCEFAGWVMKQVLTHILSSLLAVLLILLVGVVWWLLTPPPIAPLEYRIDAGGGKEFFVRRVSYPVTAIWRHEVLVSDTGQQCRDSGIAYYEAGVELVSWDMSPQLFPCLVLPSSVSRITWTPLAFGVLPLRTVEMIVPYELAVQAPTLNFSGDIPW